MKRVLRGVALALVALAIVTVRVAWSSRVEWRAAQTLSGDERIAALGRAARLYAPGNPWSRRALDELATIGRASGDDALIAWREVRSAILATRSFYTPHRALLDEANARIADLNARLDDPARGSLEARTKWHAARLAQDDAPAIGWTLLALVGLAAWIGGAIVFFTRAFDERERLRKRPALACAIGVALGLALFFLGLARA